MLALLLLMLVADPQAVRAPQAPQPSRPSRPAPPKDPFFTSTLPLPEIQNKQAVVETSRGTIVMDLLAEAAPNHVAYFITKAREGAYNGTTFHRVIPMG